MCNNRKHVNVSGFLLPAKEESPQKHHTAILATAAFWLVTPAAVCLFSIIQHHVTTAATETPQLPKIAPGMWHNILFVHLNIKDQSYPINKPCRFSVPFSPLASEQHAATFTKCSWWGFFTAVQSPQLPVRARVEKGLWRPGGKEKLRNSLRISRPFSRNLNSRIYSWLEAIILGCISFLCCFAGQKEFMGLWSREAGNVHWNTLINTTLCICRSTCFFVFL